MKKLIDVSGLGNSGKTAYGDLFREFENVYAHPELFEFGLLRLPDGILDLQYALCGNWSPSRSDFAIKRFRKLCESVDFQYSAQLTSKFMEYADEYIESLVLCKFHIEGWYDELYERNLFREKIKSTLNKYGLFKVGKSLYNTFKATNSENKKIEMFLSDGHNFIEKTNLFLNKILFSQIEGTKNILVINNAFEPFNPQNSIKYFDEVYSVVVFRDPRDIYASVVKTDEIYIPKYYNDKSFTSKNLINQQQDFLGLNDINNFITRQRLYREKMKFDNNQKRIMYVNFEDLIFNYEQTVQELLSKLDVDPELHTKKKQYFDPAQSSKNVGIWKKIRNSEEIKLIEKELKDHLYTS